MKLFIILLLSILTFGKVTAQQNIPNGAHLLLKAYPTSIKDYKDGYLMMANNKNVIYVESKERKPHAELINSNNIGDIFAYPYIRGIVKSIPKDYDPGRIRSEDLLKAMYGVTPADVQQNLTTIIWCPKLVNQKLKITKINRVDKQLQKVSYELDNHPELKDYLLNSSTFYWRKVRGSNKLSTHSFGIAIDLNTKYSNYWQWDCRCSLETTTLGYKNQIPQLIVDIFEKHGFIWGGKWYHYDTMHFEYRPELLID
ncbi:MAG: M15 family metallopeptidase [Dysgonomonas sp.]